MLPRIKLKIILIKFVSISNKTILLTSKNYSYFVSRELQIRTSIWPCWWVCRPIWMPATWVTEYRGS